MPWRGWNFSIVKAFFLCCKKKMKYFIFFTYSETALHQSATHIGRNHPHGPENRADCIRWSGAAGAIASRSAMI